MENNDRIYKQLSQDLGISRDKIQEVCMSMFGFVTTVMEKGDRGAVRLPYMGIWRCKPERVAILKDKGLL